MPVQIIAEAGITHCGDMTTALKLADSARAAGADCVKYQTYLPHLLLHENDPSKPLLEKLALSFDQFKILAIHCQTIGIEFLSTPGDIESLRFLVEECGVKRLKIGSDDLTYKPIRDSAYASGLPVILSTGMATIQEIQDALPRQPVELTLLHCVSEYPCPPEHANLRAMNELLRFGWPVGYSDHTGSAWICGLAVASGATMIEAHFCPSRYEGPDHEVSHDIHTLVNYIRDTEAVLGSGKKAPTDKEIEFQKYVRKQGDGLRGFDEGLSG